LEKNGSVICREVEFLIFFNVLKLYFYITILIEIGMLPFPSPKPPLKFGPGSERYCTDSHSKEKKIMLKKREKRNGTLNFSYNR